jgi:hypothetical protein
MFKQGGMDKIGADFIIGKEILFYLDEFVNIPH